MYTYVVLLQSYLKPSFKYDIPNSERYETWIVWFIDFCFETVCVGLKQINETEVPEPKSSFCSNSQEFK